MSNDTQAVEVFAWPREMFAFVLALVNGPDGANEYVYRRNLMVQPPGDRDLAAGQAIIHYTYGQDLDNNGKWVGDNKGTFHWNKRDFMSKYPRLPMAQPPARAPEATLRVLADVAATADSEEYRAWWAANSI